jgi:uncharacterized membrane protein (DUF485 family)
MQLQAQEKSITLRLILKNKHNISIASTFLWIGFICSISFMEAWLKFKAPHVTLPIGLGIGKVIFSALNKIEWLFAFAVYITADLKTSAALKTAFYAAILILLIQTTHLLPALNHRADLIIEGAVPPPSKIHIYYIFLEFLKTGTLLILGSFLLKDKSTNLFTKAGKLS